jgi:hypothetical protein
MTTPSTYTPTQWLDTASGNTPLSAANLNKLEQGIVGAYTKASGLALNPTIIRTGSYTLNYNDFGRFDCSAQNLVSTLPAASAGALIGVKKTDATSNTATFNPAGADTIDGSASAIVLRLQNETRMLVGISGGWVTIAGNTTVSTLDTRYTTPPLFYAVQASTQSIPHDTVTPITFSAETYDTASGHSTSATTSRYVSQKAGYYLCSGMVAYQFNNTTGVRATVLYKNGVQWAGASTESPPANALPTRLATPTVIINLALNDYVEVAAYHSAGIATSTEVTAFTASSLSVAYLSP